MRIKRVRMDKKLPCAKAHLANTTMQDQQRTTCRAKKLLRCL